MMIGKYFLCLWWQQLLSVFQLCRQNSAWWQWQCGQEAGKRKAGDDWENHEKFMKRLRRPRGCEARRGIPLLFWVFLVGVGKKCWWCQYDSGRLWDTVGHRATGPLPPPTLLFLSSPELWVSPPSPITQKLYLALGNYLHFCKFFKERNNNIHSSPLMVVQRD